VNVARAVGLPIDPCPAKLNHQFLNDVPPFDRSEPVGVPVRIREVKVSETEIQSPTCRP
jgi:hypothetical protein